MTSLMTSTACRRQNENRRDRRCVGERQEKEEVELMTEDVSDVTGNTTDGGNECSCGRYNAI